MTTKEFVLKNYFPKWNLEGFPKGELEGFPKEIITRMLDCQVEQGNERDISVFEKRVIAGQYDKGFTWNETKEGNNFWNKVINNKDFDTFFEKYPKKDNQDNSLNEELRKEAERMDMYTINQLRIISALKCRFFKDGNMYCCLYGEDLQEGIAGFGETPYQAIIEFNKELGIL